MLIWDVFTQVCLPIFVLMSFGWLLDRRFRLDINSLVKLNMYLFVPAFLFVQVVSSPLRAEMAVRVMLFTLCIVAAMLALGALAAKISGYGAPERRSLQLAAMLYNSGNYGIPLMTLAFPVTGPVLQAFVILTQNITTYTVGLFLAVSTHHSGWRRLLPMLRQVSIWAVIGAVLVRSLAIPVERWTWLWVPLQYLAAGIVAVALVTLGAQLSQTKHDAAHRTRLAWALGLRLIGGPLIALLLVMLFHFHGETAAVMILSSSFPTAVNTALLAHEFRADSDFAAAAVFFSTLGSMFTVTALVTALRLWT